MIQAAKVNALRAVHLQHTSCASCAECPHLLVSRGWLSVSWSLQRPLAGLWPTCIHDRHTQEHASTSSALIASS